MKLLVVSFVFALTFVTVQPTLVLADQDSAVCAAVQPCDEDGNILDEFLSSTSECAQVFQVRCAAQRASSKLETYVASLEAENERLQRQIRDLRRSNRRLSSLIKGRS